MVLRKKEMVQTRLWDELGLKVDKVFQGRGTSSTGMLLVGFLKIQ